MKKAVIFLSFLIFGCGKSNVLESPMIKSQVVTNMVSTGAWSLDKVTIDSVDYIVVYGQSHGDVAIIKHSK